jgi:hypothetical protein
MALFLLENRDFLGFRMIFKVWYTIIKINLYFMVYSIVLKFEKIWLSGTLNIIKKPKKSLFSRNAGVSVVTRSTFSSFMSLLNSSQMDSFNQVTLGLCFACVCW